ncbi:amino acid transporter [Trichodelitschia bisporula]|uniref:Amino acid transporter n=1 Tax=Trichodelitschia bisporula TaxID=703511 RepID=A0A6G1HIU2_9PEZI|nr:amino acid transporter [Trichodelitschia bisporula]
MAGDKEKASVRSRRVDDAAVFDDVVEAPVVGTRADQEDMRRMGRKQELNRLFSVTTLVGYAVMVAMTWPFGMITGAYSLMNGGPAGVVWVFLAVCVGLFTVVLSMAEMASIEPTAGGQYHWVSVFAPPKWRKPASYAVGWMCALGWQSYVPGAANVGATTLQGLGVVANSAYVPKAYQTVLLTILICTLAPVFNTLLARKLPVIEGCVFALYIVAFFVFLIVLVAMGEHTPAKTVFTDFQDNAGWGSIGTACFVGITGPVITLIGSDSAVHLAEELRDASRNLPRAMLGYTAVNYVLGFSMLLAFLFVIGDVDAVLASPTGQPWIQVIWDATGSRAATIVMTALIFFFFFFASVNTNTTSSRQLFAFARDGGLPYSSWISRVNPGRHVPLNAVLLTLVIGSCIAVVPLGSNAAFLNIQTIGNAGLMVSYTICVAARLHDRNWGPKRVTPPFNLGHWGGNVLNVLAILFLVVFLVSAMFPGAPNPTTESMNWASLALGLTCLVAGVSYIRLRKNYLARRGAVERVDLHVRPDGKGVKVDV